MMANNNNNNNNNSGGKLKQVVANFNLPPAVWLPNTSFLPFGLILFVFSVVILGAYPVFHYFAPFKPEWWMAAVWMGVSAIVITLFVEALVIRRLNFLSAVVQQDPRLVAGDAVAFSLMKQLPCCGRSREVDTLQKSLVNLYRASFKGRNIVYDGFTQRSVISCDDLGSEQRPFGDATFDDDDDEGNPNHSDWLNDDERSWYSPEDGLEETANRDQVDVGGSGNNPNSAQNLLNNSARSLASSTGPNITTRSKSAGGGRRGVYYSNRNSNLSASGDIGNISDSGPRSLQKQLLLHGVDPSNILPSSNPNTPRGRSGRHAYDTSSSPSAQQQNYVINDSTTTSLQEIQNHYANGANQAGSSPYGSTTSDSNMLSARSTASCVSANSTVSVSAQQQRGNYNNNNNHQQQQLLYSPRDVMLSDVNPDSTSSRNLTRLQQSQPAFLQFDPLGDNNNSSPYEIQMQGIPDPGTSLLVSIVKQISPGTPLSSITFPVHVLEPRSLLEKFADMFRHANILIDATKQADPLVRIQGVTNFFLSAYYLQLGARKPYNPIHGEVFGARIELPQTGGKCVHYLAEQVSHHPPVTFIHARCQNIFEFKAVYHAKTSLVSINCASSVGEGAIELTLFSGEPGAQTAHKYAMNWPTLFVSGFLYGGMKLELGSTTSIVDVTSFRARAKVDFARKGWISGEYDVVRATFADIRSGTFFDERSSPLFEGHWNREIYYKENPSSPQRKLIWNGPAEKASGNFARIVAVNVPDCKRQSRAIWQRLTTALRQQDVARAVQAKHEVEEAQRTWRKALANANQKHVPKLFEHASQHLSQFPAGELWDLSKWSDTETARRFFQGQLADMQVQ